MLLNPCVDKPATFPGTRLLQSTLGIVGITIVDPDDSDRLWTVQSMFAPLPKRRLGGVRAKLVDQKSFVTFLNQRDLEVLLGLARPGDFCPWTDDDYPGPGDSNWCGLCLDSEDLADDLYERELFLRATQGSPLEPCDITRRVHYEHGSDREELLQLLWDMDPDSGMCPDCRLETLDRRWVSVQRERMIWQRVF